MDDLYNVNGCMHCPYQDTNYCPYEADTPHLKIFLLSIALTLPITIPLILIGIYFG